MLKNRRTYIGMFALVITIIVIATFSITYFVMERGMQYNQDQVLKVLSNTISYTTDNGLDIAKKIESQVDDRLYYIAKELAEVLKDRPAEELTVEELNGYAKEKDLSSVAIFKRTDDQSDIEVHLSTVVEEIGVKTKSWGYWYQAFDELLNGEMVTLAKGEAKEHYWVGPKSYHYVYKDDYGIKHYYKYGYYYVEEQDYLINVIVSEEDYQAVQEVTLNQLLKEYRTEIDAITDIFVIDYRAWKDYFNTLGADLDNRDPFVIHGDFDPDVFTSFSINPNYLSPVEDHNVMVDYLGNQTSVEFKPIGNEVFAVTLINQSVVSVSNAFIVAIFILSALIVVIIVSYALSRQYSSYQTNLIIEKERLQVLENFQSVITGVPDYIYKVRRSKDRRLFITYNDGSKVGDDKYQNDYNSNVAFNECYDSGYVSMAETFIHEAFDGKRGSFEYRDNVCVLENVVMPVYENGITITDGTVQEVIVFATDVTKYVKEQEIAKFMANHDALTMLPNRLSLEKDLDNLLKGDEVFTLFFIDYDAFKAINDQYGHMIGDKVLAESASRLSNKMKEFGKAYRIGGDEFILVAIGQLPSVLSMASLIRESCEGIYTVDEHEVDVKFSIGYATYPVNGNTYESLLTYADKMMYTDKKRLR